MLFDECVDERLRLSFSGYECETARFAGLAGLKNGQLLDAAEAAGFDVLITVDQNIPSQQNLRGRRLSVLTFSGGTNRLPDLLPLVPAANDSTRRASEQWQHLTINATSDKVSVSCRP